MKTKNMIRFFLFTLLIIPSLASAHQPRVVEGRETPVAPIATTLDTNIEPAVTENE